MAATSPARLCLPGRAAPAGGSSACLVFAGLKANLQLGQTLQCCCYPAALTALLLSVRQGSSSTGESAAQCLAAVAGYLAWQCLHGIACSLQLCLVTVPPVVKYASHTPCILPSGCWQRVAHDELPPASMMPATQAMSVCHRWVSLVQGACGTCAASSATMKDGIERCLEVRALTAAAAH